MEAIEDPAVDDTTTDDVKTLPVSNDDVEVVSSESESCLKSNGIGECADVEQFASNVVVTETVSSVTETLSENEKPFNIVSVTETNISSAVIDTPITVPKIEIAETEFTNVDTTYSPDNNHSSKINEEVVETIVDEPMTVLCDADVLAEDVTVEITNFQNTTPKVMFHTEILVEQNEDESKNVQNGQNIANNILVEHSELSEALLSSNITENIENNNGPVRQEIFNKEELLHILEGNDIEKAEEQLEFRPVDPCINKISEAQLALNQLSRLKDKRRRKPGKLNRNVEKVPRNRKEVSDKNKADKQASETDGKESIVNVLVKDWEDDEPIGDQPTTLLQESNTLLQTSEQLINKHESVTDNNLEPSVITSSKETILGEGHMLKCQDQKIEDDSQTQRRQGRVIKKKVIFDPDNPDTFTKGKTPTKNRDHTSVKEQPPNKKIKSEPTPKSKSLANKLQWKKPTVKNNKQYRRLTEVDKLLMDEGAVNMIYQLTPEAPKGKKNMKTKAEFIKKIQSSTPSSTKEMKFRERKKESSKYEDGEPKKIIVGKHRTSLSSSVKSPSVCDDFETHSADDSIIYRRHSSSSYSSACMSPRRLSDVDGGIAMQSASVTEETSGNQTSTSLNEQCKNISQDVFMAETKTCLDNEIINKDDCLSIKEKLNSKLSLVLNKRKRESTKVEKSSKQKKTMKTEEKEDLNLKKEEMSTSGFLSIAFDQSLALIHIRKTGSYSTELLKELKQALLYIDNKKDISTTLVTSDCGTLCSKLELRPLLDTNIEKRTSYAYDLAEAVRSLVCTVSLHSKVVCTGVWGACSGAALALVCASDVAAASENATFMLGAAPVPGIAALVTSHSVSRNTIKDLTLFGRQLSAAEAVQCGLVGRTLWPAGDSCALQVRALAKHIAAQPAQSLLLKKQLLNINKNGEVENTFMSSLETERDLLAEYWISVEGQETIRASLNIV